MFYKSSGKINGISMINKDKRSILKVSIILILIINSCFDKNYDLNGILTGNFEGQGAFSSNDSLYAIKMADSIAISNLLNDMNKKLSLTKEYLFNERNTNYDLQVLDNSIEKMIVLFTGGLDVPANKILLRDIRQIGSKKVLFTKNTKKITVNYKIDIIQIIKILGELLKNSTQFKNGPFFKDIEKLINNSSDYFLNNKIENNEGQWEYNSICYNCKSGEYSSHGKLYIQGGQFLTIKGEIQYFDKSKFIWHEIAKSNGSNMWSFGINNMNDFGIGFYNKINSNYFQYYWIMSNGVFGNAEIIK